MSYPIDQLAVFTSRKFRRIFFKSRFGVTLIEAGIAMMVGVSALTGGSMMYASHLKNQTNTVAARQMRDVSHAFGRYVTDHYEQLLSDAAATGWVRVSVTALQPQYLSDAFSNRNAFGQEHVLAVRKPAYGVANLEAVVFTTGGEEIPPDQALSIAQAVGASGGFTLKGGSPGEVRATFDGYNLDLNDFGDPAPDTGGKLVSAIFMNEVGSTAMDYLYRKEIHDRPELNRMYTNLDMNGNDINNVQHLSAKNIRVMENVVVANDIEGGSLHATQNMEVGGDAIVTASLRAQDLHATTKISAGNDVIVAGQATAGGNVIGNVLVPTLIAKAGQSCASYGTGAIAKNANGLVLSCQKNGIWHTERASASGNGNGRFGGHLSIYRGNPAYNSTWGGYGCAPGFHAQGGGRITAGGSGRLYTCQKFVDPKEDEDDEDEDDDES